MSQFKAKEESYKRVFKIALLISLLLLTLSFYLYPKFGVLSSPEEKQIDIKIYVSDIPQTLQRSRNTPPPPAKPYGFIPVPAEEADFPEEISLSRIPGTGTTQTTLDGIAPEIPPKPVLEVYPTVSGVPCLGHIRLLILVNKNGIAETFEIIENTTQSDTCVSLAIEAAKKSRWIPAKVNNQSVDTWVTKTYKFNVKQ
jgi:hypothetical protein